MDEEEVELLINYIKCQMQGMCFVCRRYICVCMEGIQEQLETTGNLDQAVKQHFAKSFEAFGGRIKNWWRVTGVIKNQQGLSPFVRTERPFWPVQPLPPQKRPSLLDLPC